jgi:Xaa-Pro dipeptidase
VVETYSSWQELEAWLALHVTPLKVVGMEYSPHGDLPAMSRVDGGTLELIRDLGVEVRSSADLAQRAIGTWSEENLRTHRTAMGHAVEIKDLAFALVGERLREGVPCSECDVQSMISQEFTARGLVTAEAPIVAVNEHSANPHYAPSPATDVGLRPGDWLLIDLWCRTPDDQGVFADITWVGYIGRDVPQPIMEAFRAVAGARDAVVEALQAATPDEPARGYSLDRVARAQLQKAGFGDYIVHRTGHSLGSDGSLHGFAVNLDDLETHDTRPVTTGLGFTIEPGVYTPTFGVRSEINVFMQADGPLVTSPVQQTPVTIEI